MDLANSAEANPAQEKWLYGYSPTADGVEFHAIRQLSDDEYEAAGHAIKVILDVLTGPTSFAEIVRKDMTGTLAHLSERLTQRNEFRKIEVWGPEVEYRIVAASAGVRMHEEFALAAIGKLGDSAALVRAKAIFSAAYDRSQAYRVIYSLRNALVHGSKGLTTLSAKSNLNADETISASVAIRLSRKSFSASDAKASVRAEIRDLPEDPDLVALANAALDELALMRAELEPLLYPEAPAASELIFAYANELRAAGLGGPHFHAHDSGNPFGNMTSHGMNESVFNHAVTYGTRAGTGSL